MFIYRSDLSDYAISIGVWDRLCEMAGLDPEDRVEEVYIHSVGDPEHQPH